MTVAMHLHSHYSDGEDSPAILCEKLIQTCAKAGTLCDHDTIKGTREFQSRAKTAGIETIASLELSTVHNGTHNFHLLVLGYDPSKTELIEEGLQKNQAALNWCFDEIITAVNNAYGINFAIEKYRKAMNRAGQINFTLPLFKYLTNIRGYDPTEVGKVFYQSNSPTGRLISSGKLMSLEEGMNFIKSIGATPFFAHPGYFARYSLDTEGSTKEQLENAFELMLDLGLKGAEYYYPYPLDNPRAMYFAEESRRLIEKFGLWKLSGSDFHGTFKTNYCGISMPGMYFEDFLKLKKFCER